MLYLSSLRWWMVLEDCHGFGVRVRILTEERTAKSLILKKVFFKTRSTVPHHQYGSKSQLVLQIHTTAQHRNVCAYTLESLQRSNARPSKIHRRFLGIHLAVWCGTISVSDPRHRLSVQRILGGVCDLSSSIPRIFSKVVNPTRFSSTVGQFVLTASLRSQVNPENKSEFKEVSPERFVAYLLYIPTLYNRFLLQSFCRLRDGFDRVTFLCVQFLGVKILHSVPTWYRTSTI